ncbi:MAG: RNA helicase [Bacilli bacterium]|nr:RNA helicase [Bacilli bacterium]MBR6055680.1 RNA helicase [Bacilli bacterium]
MFVCPRCGNKEEKYIGFKNGEPYCRKCIIFSGEEARDIPHPPKKAPLSLAYKLSEEQSELSRRIVENFVKGVDTLVYAVCGSGKTEISYGVLAYAISHGLRAGFALPRRDVVIELYWRMMKAFPNNKIVAVYGDHHRRLEGDIVILTTHQLYRYPDYFDLLVMDEIDAFPFKGNDVLIALYKKSLRGHCVLMSATPSKAILKEFHKKNHEVLELMTRFHKKPIPVPKVNLSIPLFQTLKIIKKLREYKKEGKPCFVFAPTIVLCESLYEKVSLAVKNGSYVHSERPDKENVIDDFKKGKLDFLITTSVLERGVTIKNLQVLVFHADNRSIYDSSTLIQISGRVGRKMDSPNGEVVFFAQKQTEEMSDAIRKIEHYNTFL